MATSPQHTSDVVKTHPEGEPAVTAIRQGDAVHYRACGTDGLSVGVYDTVEHATSAANWARDFLIERPDLPRLALMQLIVEKLIEQYPDDRAEARLGPTGE